jgi:anthranilate synthase component 2
MAEGCESPSPGGPLAGTVRVVLVDNYDSFTFNIAHALAQAGASVEVVRNDSIEVEQLRALPADGYVVSAGPCTPERAGVSLPLVESLLTRPAPLLGICLGHQCLAQALGGQLVRSRSPQHGVRCALRHDSRGLFRGLAQPLPVARYNSLVVDATTVSPLLEPCGWSDEGELMALRHRELPLLGMQFHPESHLAPEATVLLERWVAACATAGDDLDRRDAARDAGHSVRLMM